LNALLLKLIYISLA